MPYATGFWGEQAKARSKKRLRYFKKASNNGYRKGNHLKIRGENIARQLLPGAKYVDKSSHDFEWNGKTVEVKSANRCKNGRWYFHMTNKTQLTADYWLLIMLKKDKYLTSYFVPSENISGSLSCVYDYFAEYEIFNQKVR